ncbi:phosphodiester glycosidase family protein [Hyphococcus sp.]|uniref:phosphodiester glycosidase family protein n=1 Tax=Hyphococcus sp. TaxID=2038636 RepID=UPI0035C7549D
MPKITKPMAMRVKAAATAAFLVLAAGPALAAPPCVKTTYRHADYVVCRVDPQANDIRLFLNKADGEPFGHFNWVKESLEKEGEKLIFAMNAGMYHEDRAPVGLYVEAGEKLAPLNDNDGPGNFHLKPNGVFYVTSAGAAGVAETSAFEKLGADMTYATQSGPMLVIDSDIHPRFLPESDSLKRRNGVGVTEDGDVIFVLADSPVRFYDFASYFRDELNTPNALYLDGTISRLYAPALDRNDPGVAMGPIIGVVSAE